jgi:hypothetical protein
MLKKSDFAPIIFFTLFFIIGMSIYRDYGVPFDEKAQMLIGDTNYQYIAQENQDLLTFKDRYYGPFFEIPLSVLADNLPSQSVVYYRHLAVFLTFFAGTIGLYFLALKVFKNSWWALLSAALLVIHPRILADSFYNSKDIPFMAFFILGIWALIQVLDMLLKGKHGIEVWGMMAFLAFLCAATITIRIPGITLVGLSVVLMLAAILKHPVNKKLSLVLLAFYLAATIGLTILFWPILWHDPVREFLNAFQLMSRFPWPGSTLYLGKFIEAKYSVWHYLPVWVAISTPYLQLGSFLLGIFCLGFIALKSIFHRFNTPFKSWKEWVTFDSLSWLAIVGWLVIPIIAILVLHSILYDGWRQMFFIYPAMVLIAILGIKTVYQWMLGISKNKTFTEVAFRLVFAIGLLEPIFFLVNNHPFENSYFNAFAGNPATIRQQFEMDYWGLSNKQGIDAILANDLREKIRISVSTPGQLYVLYMLPGEQASRLSFVDSKEADYFLTTYRFHPNDYPYPDRFFSIKVRGTEIMTVYKMRQPLKP